jgi:hypothetical protein
MIYVLSYSDYEVLCDSNLLSKYDSVQCLSLLHNSDARIEMQFISYFSKKIIFPLLFMRSSHNNVSASTSVNSMLRVIFEVMVGRV